MPSLVDLHVTASAHASSCAELAACVGLLPALTSLDVRLVVPQEPPPTAEVPLSAYTCLAGAPAPLPALQNLFIYEGHSCTDTEDCDDVIDPLQPPLHACCTADLLSFLAAPALRLLELTICPPLTSLKPLVSAMCRCSAVQELDIRARLDSSCLPGATTAMSLPALTSAVIDGPSAVSALLLATTIAKLRPPQLTSLQLCPDEGSPKHTDADTPRQAAGLWQALAEALHQCTTLEKLTLKCLGCGPRAQMFASAHLADAISPLIQLTALTFKPMSAVDTTLLEGHAISRALSSLTALEHLSFEPMCDETYDASGRFEFDAVQPVLDACTRLERLTYLTLCCTGEGILMSEVITMLQNKPGLKELRLTVDFGDDVDEAAAEVAMNELRRRFHEVNIHWCIGC